MLHWLQKMKNIVIQDCQCPRLCLWRITLRHKNNVKNVSLLGWLCPLPWCCCDLCRVSDLEFWHEWLFHCAFRARGLFFFFFKISGHRGLQCKTRCDAAFTYKLTHHSSVSLITKVKLWSFQSTHFRNEFLVCLKQGCNCRIILSKMSTYYTFS